MTQRSTTSIPHLTTELILYEIIIRLPVKCLVRFKSVCKQWYSMISSPWFAKLHHLRMTSHPGLLQQCAFILSSETFLMLNCEAYDKSMSGNDHTEGLVETCGFCSWAEDAFLIGSCNGLVCLSCKFEFGKPDIKIYNPCTGDCLQVSDPPRDFRGNLIFGFGYVSTLDDYKLVILGLRDRKSFIYVYLLGSKQWKRSHQFNQHDFAEFIGDVGVLVAETLHWDMAWKPESKSFVGFNLVDETFKEVKLPRLSLAIEPFDPILCSLDGCLCVWAETRVGQVEMWMLKQYGNWESWTKLLKVDALPLWAECCNKFLGSTKSGEFLVRSDEQRIMVVDPNQDPVRFSLISRDLYALDAVSYVKTLISPINL